MNLKNFLKCKSGHFVALIFAALIFMVFACKRSETSSEPPEENRFTKVVLAQGMDEPMEMAFLKDGRVLIVERKGALKSFDTKTNLMKTIATIPVNTKYTSKEGKVSEAEEGLMGIVAHPDFEKNHWIYMYYADPKETKHVLARWELQDDKLVESSKKIVLEVGTQREICCHTGGGMVFDKEANLYLTVGNNTANPAVGTSALDERPGHENADDQRSAGNTNDLRGKILRIHPEDDGSYSIPEGNLFPKGTAKTRPEIYVMGDRNPWRVSVDSKTGYLYWGEVGPDASIDTVYGPRGYDEFNQARKAGFFGWPYFIADNKPYVDYNYADSSFHGKFDVNNPVNNSPNNTGLKNLPKPQKAFIYYPYSTSEEFPLVGSSGRSATGGPVFRQADFEGAKRPFPAYYEGKWMIVDFMRGWIMSVTMDDNGDYKSMERFLPKENFSSAIDMKFGPEGDLYVLEYGSSWFRGNANSALVRIEYNAGNRKPVVEASANKLAGAVPFKVNLSSKGTLDYDKYDKGELKYEWKINLGNKVIKTITEENPVLTLDKPGVYQATLTVTDTKGEKNSKTLQLKAGNEPPVVSVDILKGNKSFFFPNQPIQYAISVSDKEDGSVKNGKISQDVVSVNFDYVPEGFDPIAIAQNHVASDEKAGFSAGLSLINSSDCKSCHAIDKTSIGPSFNAVSLKYKKDKEIVPHLATKIITGGSGVWGQHAMSAHPQITQPEAETMVKYILSLTEKKAVAKSLPLSGSYVPQIPAGENGKGGFLLRAAYTDKGTSVMPPLSTESIVALRNPLLDPEKADIQKGTQLMTTPSRSFFMTGNNSHLAYNNLDLTGIKQIDFLVQASPNSGALGGVIEVHLDSPTGKLIGKTETVVPKAVNFARIMENMGGGKAKPGTKAKAEGPNKGGPPKKIDFSMIRRLMAKEVIATLQPADGRHTIYFVFKNDKAKDNQIIMQMLEINFKNR